MIVIAIYNAIVRDTRSKTSAITPIDTSESTLSIGGSRETQLAVLPVSSPLPIHDVESTIVPEDRLNGAILRRDAEWRARRSGIFERAPL